MNTRHWKKAQFLANLW